MASQKLESLLSLALLANEEERSRSGQLSVGYEPDKKVWELIVKYNGDISRLESNLIQVEELIAGYAIVTLPENLIETFTRLSEVEYVEMPKRLFFSQLRGKAVSCIFPVTEREPFLTGEGVLVGVIDSGIDYQSPEFLSEDGSSRIQAIWDQNLTAEEVNKAVGANGEFAGTAMPPAGFKTGVEFDKYRIDAALRIRNPGQLVPSFDTSGHGTAVTAIAAAGGNFGSGQYQGVAPESELLIVKLGSPIAGSFPRTTELMRALTYLVKKAVELEKPLAINLSFGNTYGAHDGTSLLERFLDNVAEIGKTVICVGSGNEGAAGGHVSGRTEDVQAGGSLRVELNVAEYQSTFSVQLWKEYVDRFSITLISPSGTREEIDTFRTGIDRVTIEQTEILIYVGEPSPYSVNQEIYFDFLPMGAYVSAGVWAFELREINTALGSYDFYLPSDNVLNAGTGFFAPQPDKTLTIPSTASKVITVGAYDAVYDAYADFSGRGYPLQSVVGERVNQGSIKPDIAAPGVAINTIGPQGAFVQVSGTSFATPFVTGSAALLMEWGIVRGNDPYLYGEKIKAYLRKGAREIRGENVYPNERVGYGALCVEDSLPGN